MNRLKVITGILLIFFTGATTGYLGSVAYYKNKIYNQGPPAIHWLLKKKFSNKLNLTRSQQIEFARVMTQMETEFNAFRKTHLPEIEQILLRCFQQINAALTPEQSMEFEIIKSQFIRKFIHPIENQNIDIPQNNENLN